MVIKPQEKRTKEEGKKRDVKKQTQNKKIAIEIHISIITLNVNGLNESTKRQTG